MEFDKNISKLLQKIGPTTKSAEIFTFTIRLVKWQKMTVKKGQNQTSKVNCQFKKKINKILNHSDFLKLR